MPARKVPRKREGFPDQRLLILPAPVTARLQAGQATGNLFPIRIGFFPLAENHYVERRSGIADHLLLLCHSGSGEGLAGKQPFKLHPGRGVILPARQPHWYAASQDTPWSLSWIHYRGRLAGQYHQSFLPTSLKPTFHVRQAEKNREEFEELSRLMSGTYTDANLLLMHAHLAQFLAELAHFQSESEQRSSNSAQRVATVIHQLRRNLHRRVEIEEMARWAHWTPNHFNTVFRHHIHETPAAFFQRLQMAKACEWLTTTDLPISRIANQLGYEDPFYFSRCFRRCYRMAPSTARKLSGAHRV